MQPGGDPSDHLRTVLDGIFSNADHEIVGFVIRSIYTQPDGSEYGHGSAPRRALVAIGKAVAAHQIIEQKSFESGALAKNTSERRLCTFLWHVGVDDVAKPLVPFQHTTAQNKQDVKQMAETINQTLGVFSIDQQRLDKRFQTAWKGLQHDLERLSTTKPPAREDKLLQGINEIRVML